MSTPFSKMGWLSAALRGADDLSHAQKTVLTVMWTYASSGDGGDIRPGRNRLMADARVDPKTLSPAIDRLIERGYIELVEKGGNEVRKGWANTYRLSMPVRLRNPQGGDSLDPYESESHPQGGEPFPQGGEPFPQRGPMVPLQGVESVDPHPVIDPGIHPVIESFTINSEESMRDSQRLITKKQRQQLIDRITFEAHTLISNNCTQEDYQSASMDTYGDIENFLGDEAAGEWVNYWTVNGQLVERYAAGKKLNQFINACIEKGITLEGAAA
ncbi:hypothetical protein ACU4IU_12620 [Brevibacterium sp. CSND-B09]|uniref:hypothetical protein n=1 Tax=Brevibacterium sp. CSND-B09 TaxID=3462571 RepID=UPI00406A82CE